MSFLLVFLGAGIGGMMRHAVNLGTLRFIGAELPLGTLFVNITGSFCIGLVAEYWALKSGLPQPMRLFLTTGIMGGYTTFSAFSLETALLYERGQALTAFAYAVLSVILSVGALFAALWLIRTLDARGVL